MIVIVKRCPWATKSPQLMIYHDTVWGKPTFDSAKLFKALSLEIMQAGLTFDTVLKFEDGMDETFKDFSVNYLAKCSDKDIQKFLQNKKVIRNRAKITALIENAKIVKSNPNILVNLTWEPVNFTQLDHLLQSAPQTEDYSEFLKKFLGPFKAKGFARIGKVTLYSYLQAVGVVNDHLLDCDFR